MIQERILADLENKSFYHLADNIRKLTAIEQLNLDQHWKDYVPDLVDYGYRYLLKGFQFRVILEEEA
jgi:hypothetical protein